MGEWLRPLTNRRWRGVTLVVLVGIGVLVRLGIWQLDRLEQRRASNALLAEQLAQPAVLLTGKEGPDVLLTMENREVAAAGSFDYEHQFIVLLQDWQGRTGVHIVTPLMLTTDQAVLVDRGWIPQEESTQADAYNLSNPIALNGYVQLSQVPTYGNRNTEPQPFQPEQYRVDIDVMQAQLPYDLLPVFLQQAPSGDNSLPYRAEREIDLSAGPHLSYALQWFSFALLLAGGYVYYVQQQEKRGKNTDRMNRDEPD